MGLLNSRFFWKRRRNTLDKANFTSECSVESYLSTPSSSLCRLICGEREESCGFTVYEEEEAESLETKKEKSQEREEAVGKRGEGDRVIKETRGMKEEVRDIGRREDCIERRQENNRGKEEGVGKKKEEIRWMEKDNGISQEEDREKEGYSETKDSSFTDRDLEISARDTDEEKESYRIENLGITKVTSDDGECCYNCIFYVPECDIIMTHYVTLYHLKLDTVTKNYFENWCNKIGHYQTLKKYSTLVSIYNNMKKTHFRESFIINRIISRQNVYFKISDIFGELHNQLRAVIIIGDRKSVIQNVVDSYCFAVKGKVTFVIRSVEDYKKFVNSSIQLKPDSCNLTKSISNNCRILRSRMTEASKSRVYSVSNTYSNSLNFFNIPHNSINDLTVNPIATKHLITNPKTPVQEYFDNYSRFSKRQCSVEDVCYNNPIYSEGGTYNLVSIIADSTYAYILCRNSDMNGENYDNMDLNLINTDDLTNSENELNQSNSYHRINALKTILRSEIIECCNKRFYGVALSKISIGEVYIVRCCINDNVPNRDKLLNEILNRHRVCGKIVKKELQLMVHLHGNKNGVQKCCLELTTEGLARNFQCIHPYSSG